MSPFSKASWKLVRKLRRIYICASRGEGGVSEVGHAAVSRTSRLRALCQRRLSATVPSTYWQVFSIHKALFKDLKGKDLKTLRRETLLFTGVMKEGFPQGSSV